MIAAAPAPAVSRRPFDPRRGAQPMVTGWVGAVTMLGMVFLASQGKLSVVSSQLNQWLLAILVSFATMVLVDRLVGWEQKDQYRKESVTRKLAKSALARWLAGLFLLAAAVALHRYAPYFSRFQFFLRYLEIFTTGWLLLGLPYCLLTLRYRSSRRADLCDPLLYVLLFARAIWRWRVPAGRNLLTRLRRARRSRVVLSGLVVKIFFLPLMTNFFFSHCQHIWELQDELHRQWLSTPTHSLWPIDALPIGLTDAIFQISFSTLFLLDCGFAALGYAVTSRWLGNSIRSVEPTLLGWASCVICYPPFLWAPGWLVRSIQASPRAVPEGQLRLGLQAGILIFLFIYVWATLAFGLRFSNLTHRGIITRGPYRWIRHPAYVAKNGMWWLGYVLGTGLPGGAMALVWVGAVYSLRAITEERHLSADPAYRAYAARVRWRFIPGVI